MESNCIDPLGHTHHMQEQERTRQAQVQFNDAWAKMDNQTRADFTVNVKLIMVPILGAVGIALLATQPLSSSAWIAGLVLTLVCGLPGMGLCCVWGQNLCKEIGPKSSEKTGLLSSSNV